MKRHYYISYDLDELEQIELELEARGIHSEQIHVFSKDDAGVQTHDHLQNIKSVFRNDIIHGTVKGVWAGVVCAALVLVITAFNGWADTYTWMPFIFLAIVLLGFCAWAGGLYGIQEPHQDFKRFEPQLRLGRHVFIVDVDPEQEKDLDIVVGGHTRLLLAGTGKATPGWILKSQHNIKEFTSHTFP